jgi:hypothetical protein
METPQQFVETDYATNLRSQIPTPGTTIADLTNWGFLVKLSNGLLLITGMAAPIIKAASRKYWNSAACLSFTGQKETQVVLGRMK